MSENRIHLTLTVKDEELLNNFIKPYKDARQLEKIILRCLTAYHENAIIKNAVDNIYIDDKVGSQIPTNMRDSVGSQGSLKASLQQDLAECGASLVGLISGIEGSISGVVKGSHENLEDIDSEQVDSLIDKLSSANFMLDSVMDDVLKPVKISA